MGIRTELRTEWITTKTIVGLVFLYASAVLIDGVSGLLFGLRELAGIVPIFSFVSDALFFVALCLTVYTTGKYLATN